MSTTAASHDRGREAGCRAYYNEIDPHAAQWLRKLITAGLIAPGDVDTRSITDVRPSDLRGYTQCHFFAGIGGWSYALRQAGWDDTRPVWTGSCPCQPFSLAGKQKGFDDERHLWPVWRELIRECAPAVVFGEQVASATDWLRLVRGDLEAMGRAVGAMPIQAASAGADHLRDRYWFVAHTDDARSQGWELLPECTGERTAGADGLADAAGDDERRDRSSGKSCGSQVASRGLCAANDMADGDGQRQPGRSQQHGREIGPEQQTSLGNDTVRCDLDWVIGADGKARRVKSGIRLLAHGVPNRVGTLRGFGNAIDYRPAKEFIGAFIDTMRAPALCSKDGTGGAA